MLSLPTMNPTKAPERTEEDKNVATITEKHIRGDEIADRVRQQTKRLGLNRRYTFILQTEDNEPTQSKATRPKCEELEIFGMWKDRADMQNPTEYVQKLRQPRYKI